MSYSIIFALAIPSLASVSSNAVDAEDRHANVSPAVACSAMSNVRLPAVRITEAIAVDPAMQPASPTRVRHCRVSGVIGKEIRFTALLPEVWNHRFFMGGGGGYVGNLQNMAAESVNLGYATVGTNTGHDGAIVLAGWALDNLERQVNFGYLAVHRTAEVTKAILRAYYDADPEYSYFFGCSNGGRQALMEAQRYPEDFDGIVSAAPALNFTRIATSFVKNEQAAFPDPRNLTKPLVTRENLQLLASHVLEACDARDGVKDGVLDDPRTCSFRVASLRACPDDQPAADCLTRAQRSAIERIYAPATDSHGQIYPGQPFGGEGEDAGWQSWITGVSESLLAATKGQASTTQAVFAGEFFKYFVFGDSSWDYSRYDLSRWASDTRLAATFLNADDPDLAPFNRRGGKLILWHGWSDPALNPLATIRYYEQLQTRDPNVRDHARLFLLPGVLHCADGAGPSQADWFTPIADWVERGKAPARVIAAKMDGNAKVVRTRPLCPYPERASYTGRGSSDEEGNFVCRQERP